MKELGFQSIGIIGGSKPLKNSLGEIPIFFYNLDEKVKKQIKEELNNFKHISLHQSWDKEWKKWIDLAIYIGAEIITIHSGLPKEGESIGILLKNKKISFTG